MAVGFRLLDFIDNIHTFDNLTENGVLVIKMGSTADGCICLALRGGKRCRIFSDL